MVREKTASKRIASLGKKNAVLEKRLCLYSEAFVILSKENADLRKKLNECARDPITGLLTDINLIDNEINLLAALAERSEKILALLFIDINDFKAINDTYLHKTGDLVIFETSISISGCLRESDLLARRGNRSDEFIIAAFFEKEDAEKKIKAFAERIRARVSEKNIASGENSLISVSVAIGYVIRNSEHTIEQDLSIAEMKMYCNKSDMKMNK